MCAFDRRLLKRWGAESLVCALAMGGSAPFLLLALFVAPKSLAGFWITVLVGETMLCLFWAPLSALSMLVITPRRRSTAQGINLLASHLLGDAFSPPLIGALVDFTLAKSGCADESHGHNSSWIGLDMQAVEYQDARCVDQPCSWGNNITGSCCWDVSQTACTNSARSQASAYQLWLYLTLPMVIVAFFCFLLGARRQQADHAAMKTAVEAELPQQAELPQHTVQ
eukprot:COSAG05_NODE_7528_length_800_cov_1.764622_1_plen_225_part_00